jgi:hypothetical protein
MKSTLTIFCYLSILWLTFNCPSSLYYQHDTERTSTCPLTTHALLHLADMIKNMGPVWTYWAFPTERYCGRLQPAIRSRRYPFACIDNYLIQYAHLSQIKTLYGLEDELNMSPRSTNLVDRTDIYSNPACESMSFTRNKS